MLAHDLARGLDAALVMKDAGFVCDRWQKKALRSDSKKAQWLVSRQGGKSTTAAGPSSPPIVHRMKLVDHLLGAKVRAADNTSQL